MEQIHRKNYHAIYSPALLAKVNMYAEKLYCARCKIHVHIEFDEDESPDFLEPNFCPMCAEEFNGEPEDIEWDE